MNYDIKILNNADGAGKLELDRISFLAKHLKRISRKALLLRLFGYSKVSLPAKMKKHLNVYLTQQLSENNVISLNLDADNFQYLPVQLDAFHDKTEFRDLTPVSLIISSFRAALIEDEDKNLLDEPLIDALIQIRTFFKSDAEEILMSNRGSIPEIRFSSKQIDQVENLYKSIPEPQKVMINGVIDEMKYSKKQLVLVTGNKERVIVQPQDDRLITGITSYFGKEITLSGTAHYKPGGQLSFVTLDSFGEPGKGDRFFSKKPHKMSVQQQIAMQLRQGKKANPLDDVIGKWPGNETDEEFDQMLKELD